MANASEAALGLKTYPCVFVCSTIFRTLSPVHTCVQLYIYVAPLCVSTPGVAGLATSASPVG